MILKNHNRESVEKILKSFENHEKVLYVSGVGTGKSFVFMQIMIMHPDIRALFVVPKHAIRENIFTYEEFDKIKDRVDFCTYNSFTSVEKGMELIAPYDIVVIDEAHHIGSDIYGKNLLECMNKTNDTNFLGLTATPVREMGKVDVTVFF